MYAMKASSATSPWLNALSMPCSIHLGGGVIAPDAGIRHGGVEPVTPLLDQWEHPLAACAIISTMLVNSGMT